MHTLAFVLAALPAAVLAQSPLWGQCMWHLLLILAARLTILPCLLHNRWRHRLDGSHDLRFWLSMPKEQVSSPSH